VNNLAIPDQIRSAEASVLGGLLLKPAILRDLELEVADFGHLPHQVVFAAMRNLEADATPIDTVTLENEIAKLGKLDAIGGVALLGELALHVPTTENVHAYADIVRDQRLKRRVIAAAGEVLQLAHTNCSGDELLGEANARIGRIDGPQAESARGIGEVCWDRFKALEKFAQEKERTGKQPLTGVSTGVKKLDEKTGGYQRGIVSIIAGRPAMGKSAAARAAADAMSETGNGVHVFSLEDSEQAYADNQLAKLSGVAGSKIRAADLNGDDIGHVFAAVMRMRQRTNWLLDERGGLSASEIVRAVRRHADKNNTQGVVIDYLNLLRLPKRATSAEELGEAMQTFADAAKADHMAYVVLAQLNRDIEKRVDKRPQMSDLRGSGEIEEKCKLAIGVYRGSYYGGKPKRGVDYECDCPEGARACEHTPSDEDFEHDIQLVVMKNNNGPTGVVHAYWVGPTTHVS